ncbi:hypothetical protein J4209_04075 [Candidatus Woesearchaeota archaeon]|nr:hypothetical protein [Candidatus Woesearchaeota archaeon]
MEIEFDFREEQSRIFGQILRPVAEVTFINNEKEVLEYPYVDSGADISLIPKSVGNFLGFEIGKADEITEIKGIGERGVPIIIKKAKIRIGEKLFETRIAWALIEEVPLLLGRTDVFNLFDICFEKNKKTIFSE